MDDKQLRRKFWRATFWIVLPFVIAWAPTVPMRYGAQDSARLDLRRFCLRLMEAGAKPGDEARARAVDRVVKDTYGRECIGLPVSEPCTRMRIAVAALAHAIDDPRECATEQGHEHPAFIWRKLDLLLLILTHLALLAFFPGMLIGQLIRARRRLLDAHGRSREALSFEEWVEVQSAARQLDEAGGGFWSRLGMGIFISLGLLYVFRPLGMRTAAVQQWAHMNGLPSEGSYPVWFDGMAGAPPVTLGICGFILYALTSFLRRYNAGELDQSALIPLLTRGFVVILVGLALAGLAPASAGAGALAFVAGVFPRRGLDAIGKWAGAGALKLDDEKAFVRVPQIDFWKRAMLSDRGIDNVHDLANSSVEELIIDSGINARTVLGAVDRAVLVANVDDAQLEKLAQVPVLTATDLVAHIERAPEDEREAREEQVRAAMEVIDLAPLLRRLSRQPNVVFILGLKDDFAL